MVRMQAADDKSAVVTKSGSSASVKNGEVVVDQSVVLDRKPEDMVQYMVENGDLTLVPSDFIKPAQQRVTYSGQKEIVDGGVNCVQIPVIDMALLKGDKPKLLADVIRASEWGFLQVVNHGVPDALMDAAMDMTKRFFALPSTEKEEFKIRKVGGLGYGRYFEKPGATKDWVDRAFTCTYNLDVGEPYDLKYTKPPGFQEVIETYGIAVHELARKILALLSEGLGQRADLFDKEFPREATTLRSNLNYYPACPQPELAMGASEHTDASIFTILQQGDVSGLEVLNDGSSTWVPVPPIPHAFVVNIGDCLQSASNDRFKSLIHRAVVGPVDRITIANFFLPWRNVLVQPAAQLCTKAKPPAFRSIKYEDYFFLIVQNEINSNGIERLRVDPAEKKTETENRRRLAQVLDFQEMVSGVAEAYNAIIDKEHHAHPPHLRQDHFKSPCNRHQRKKRDLGAFPWLQTPKSYHDKWIPNCRKTLSSDQEVYLSSGSRASDELEGL